MPQEYKKQNILLKIIANIKQKQKYLDNSIKANVQEQEEKYVNNLKENVKAKEIKKEEVVKQTIIGNTESELFK